MFKFEENDIVVFHKTPNVLYIVTLDSSESRVYLTAGTEHSSFGYYHSILGNDMTVFRAKCVSSKALLKRTHGVDAYFDVCNPPAYLSQVYTTIKEYTMAELVKIVGHPFKLVK